MTEDPPGKKGSNSAIVEDDPAAEILSGRRLPFKGQDLSDNVSFWLMEKEGQFARLTVDSYRHSLKQFVAFWNQHKRGCKSISRAKLPHDSLRSPVHHK